LFLIGSDSRRRATSFPKREECSWNYAASIQFFEKDDMPLLKKLAIKF